MFLEIDENSHIPTSSSVVCAAERNAKVNTIRAPAAFSKGQTSLQRTLPSVFRDWGASDVAVSNMNIF